MKLRCVRIGLQGRLGLPNLRQPLEGQLLLQFISTVYLPLTTSPHYRNSDIESETIVNDLGHVLIPEVLKVPCQAFVVNFA